MVASRCPTPAAARVASGSWPSIPHVRSTGGGTAETAGSSSSGRTYDHSVNLDDYAFDDVQERRRRYEAEEAAVAADLVAAGVSAVPLGGLLVGLFQARRGREQRKQVRLLEELVTRLGDRLDQLASMMENPDVAELVDRALDVAVQIRTEEQLALLAAVVADGLGTNGEPPKIDQSHLLIDVIGQLEPPHVELLRDLWLFQTGNESLWRSVDSPTGHSVRVLALPLQPSDSAFAPMMGRLTSLGLVERQTRSDDSYYWVLTLFGKELLDHLVPLNQVRALPPKWERSQNHDRGG